MPVFEHPDQASLCSWLKSEYVVPEEGVEPTRGVIPGRF